MLPISIYSSRTDEALDENEEAVEAALATVMCSAKCFMLQNLAQVANIARRVEMLFDKRGLRQDLRKGVEVSYTPAGPETNRYRNGSTSIRITLKRMSNGVWRLTEIEQVTVMPKSSESRIIRISAAANEYIRDKSVEAFTIAESETVLNT